MKKTRLMQLAEAYGDRGVGASLTTSTIDAVVYMLSDMAESAFGPQIIDAMKHDIALTQGGFPKKKSLEIITSEFIKKFLLEELKMHKVDKVSSDIQKLPPLSDKTYVDYFVTFTSIEHNTLRTPISKSANKISSILAGYSTESAYPVCDGIVSFFKETENPAGCVELIKTLCSEIKKKSKVRVISSKL